MYRVYIAGPIRAESNALELENVNRAMEAGYKLVKAGFAVYLPHTFWFVDRLAIMDGREPIQDGYLEQDLHWILACDMMLRLPGKSAGVEKELIEAHKCCLPIFTTVEEIIQKYPEMKGVA